MVVVAICGTPGTGKSSLARLLRERGFDIVEIGSFVIENKLYAGFDASRGVFVLDEQKFLNNISKLIETMRKENANIVIVGIGAEILPPELVDLCVVLTCEPFELERRLVERGYSRKKIEENLEAERFGVILGDAINNYPRDKIVVIDTTYKTTEQILELVINALKQRGLNI